MLGWFKCDVRTAVLGALLAALAAVPALAQSRDSLFGIPGNAPTAIQRTYGGAGAPPAAQQAPAGGGSGAVVSPGAVTGTASANAAMPILQAGKAGSPVLPPELTPEQRALASRYVSQYKMGSGDVVTIRVFGEDDLSREKIRITDSGTIFVPAIGEMSVLGLKIGEIEKLVADGLRGRILVNPQVAVFVEEYRPFFINGKVTRPGGYPYIPGLTVRKAAAIAGGFMDRASLSKIFVIRSEDTSQQSVKIDLNELVFPGDIVTVEESFF